MNDNMHLIFGSQYAKPKSTEVFPFEDRVAGGLAPGHKACIKKKMDGNEDAMAFGRLSSGEAVMLLADAHFGSSAGETAVAGFSSVFQEAVGSNTLKLLTSHFRLDEKIRDQRAADPHNLSSTTFISVLAESNCAHWCSTGDSHLFLLRRGELSKINESHPNLFVGDVSASITGVRWILRKFGCIDDMTETDPMIQALYEVTAFRKRVDIMDASVDDAQALLARIESITGLPQTIDPEDLLQTWFELYLDLSKCAPFWGTQRLVAGDVLLLASDGIDEVESNCSLEDLEETMARDNDVQVMVKNILKKCTTRRGNNDNLMILAARF